MAEAPLVLLLPALRRFGGRPLPAALGLALARADRHAAEGGGLAQLRRHLQPLGDDAWPIAALQRAQRHGASAVGQRHWLRADPVFWQADLSTARLMAWGNLGLSPEEAGSLADSLRPAFDERGLEFEVLGPHAWCLGLPEGVAWPAFTHPLDALGDDAYGHLPSGPAMRPLRSLLGEVQVMLHQHPVNIERASAGLPPVNSLWFWGVGRLPERVQASARAVFSLDDEVTALAHAAGRLRLEEPRAESGVLMDLRHERDADRWAAILDEVLSVLRRGEVSSVQLDSADGEQFTLHRGQRWRWWRRPMATWPA